MLVRGSVYKIALVGSCFMFDSIHYPFNHVFKKIYAIRAWHQKSFLWKFAFSNPDLSLFFSFKTMEQCFVFLFAHFIA